MGLPKSPAQLRKRNGHGSADHCPAWAFSPTLQFMKSSWACRKGRSKSTPHLRNTTHRLHRAGGGAVTIHLCQCSAVLWLISPTKRGVTALDPLRLGPPAFWHIHATNIYMLCPVMRADGKSPQLRAVQDSSLLLFCAQVTSFPSPLALGTSHTWKSSWEWARPCPPPVRAESLQMRNGGLNPWSMLRPFKSHTAALACSRLPFPTMPPGKLRDFWRGFLSRKDKHEVDTHGVPCKHLWV